ncbi:MAG TPA: hypothetical protein VF224_08285 [Aestuariivirga sp.]
MKRWFRLLAFGTAIVFSGSDAAWAKSYVSLVAIEGNVLVNQGKGFEPVSGVVDLKVGDRVMVGENSQAVLSYATCRVKIKGGNVVTIVKDAPCLAGTVSEDAAMPVVPGAVLGGFVHPGVVVGQFAGGFVGLVGVNEYVISAAAAN